MHGSNKMDFQKDSEYSVGTATVALDCMDTHQQTRTSDNVAFPERQMRELALFAGAGGGILGGKLLGWKCVCAVEIDAYCQKVLLARQRDGHLPRFPIWDDVRTFDGQAWRGYVDVVSGGFPCTDISVAGKGAGITGAQSGLWKEMARIVGEVRPRFVFVENSPALTSRGLGVVLGDLAAMGYDARWGVLGADDAGAPHIRKRIWIVADAAGKGLQDWRGGSVGRSEAQQELKRYGCEVSHAALKRGNGGEHGDYKSEREVPPQIRRKGSHVSHADNTGCQKQPRPEPAPEKHATAKCGGWWEAEPRLGRVVARMANRVERLKAIGNGQVPAVAALAWETLT